MKITKSEIRTAKMEAIVVIPVYQSMNSLEKISLQQAVCIFRMETICLVAPKRLDVSDYLAYGNFQVERFDDYYFRSIDGYNELLLGSQFYERFLAYDYLLIYQLDAFVFRDALPYFCSLGYDYFGAPWPIGIPWPSRSGNHRLTRIGVGNGGLSLRHVKHTVDLLYSYRDFIERDWIPRKINEDVFFAWAAMQKNAKYTTAPREVAMRFSLQCDVSHIFRQLSEDHLPFGIHKWYQMDLQIWLPYIERCGYLIDRSDSHICWRTSMDSRRGKVQNWAMRRLVKYGDASRICAIIKRILPTERTIYLRGAGEVGSCVHSVLQKAQVFVGGILVRGDVLPDGNAFVLVASTKYEEEIVQELVQAGRKEGRDFKTARNFADCFLREYYDKT